MEISRLVSEPIKQQAWRLQTKDDFNNTKRPIDKKSVVQIYEMFKEKKFICDICGKNISISREINLEEHIIHVINPEVIWTCEDCFQLDLRNGRIIAISKEPEPEKWQIENK